MKVHHNAQELIHWLREHQPATVAQIAANGVMNSRDASDAPRADLLKAVQRFRDGDLGGAISPACGAVDNAVVSVLGVLGRSFQEGCNRALATVGLETVLSH